MGESEGREDAVLCVDVAEEEGVLKPALLGDFIKMKQSVCQTALAR